MFPVKWDRVNKDSIMGAAGGREGPVGRTGVVLQPLTSPTPHLWYIYTPGPMIINSFNKNLRTMTFKVVGLLLVATVAVAEVVDQKKHTKRGLWDTGDAGWNGLSLGSGWDSGISLGGWDSPSLSPWPAQPISHGVVKAITIQKEVPVAVPQPYPVTVEKHVPYPVKVPVEVPVDRPYPVAVPKPYPVTVEKHVPYPVERPVPYPVKVPVKVAVPAPYPVAVPKPYPVAVEKHVPVPYPQPILVKKPVPVLIKDQGWSPEWSPQTLSIGSHPW